MAGKLGNPPYEPPIIISAHAIIFGKNISIPAPANSELAIVQNTAILHGLLEKRIPGINLATVVGLSVLIKSGLMKAKTLHW